MRLLLTCVLVASSGAAVAAPDKPTLDLVGADGIDPSTHYLVALPDLLVEARKHVDDIASCAGTGGQTPEMRTPILRSVLANAGLSACRAFDI